MGVGVDLIDVFLMLLFNGKINVFVVIGKVGLGKIFLLVELMKVLKEVGVDIVFGDWEGKKCKDCWILVILVLMNKVVLVLWNCGVFVIIIYCIFYMLVYDLEYECIVEWLVGEGDWFEIEGLIDVVFECVWMLF